MTDVQANLARADLSGANLAVADLSDANLSGANLAVADLSDASLARANLSGANLSGANLSGANLSGVVLSDAYLGGTNLFGADLTGANLSGASLARVYYLIDGGQRVDGYRFVGWVRDGALMIRAGCRDMTLADYREHNAKRDNATLRAETDAILTHIEAVAIARGLVSP